MSTNPSALATTCTSNITNMNYMLDHAFGNLTDKFNQDIGSWNTSQVTDMRYMFMDALNSTRTCPRGVS